MHFKTLVLAGFSSLAAVAALPSASHDAHVMPRHHRFVRPRKVDHAPSKVKRCTASSTTEEPEAATSPIYVGNAAKPTTKSASGTKSSSATKTASAAEPTETETEPEPETETSTEEAPAPTAGTGGISINDKLLAIFPGGTASGSKWSTNPAFKGAIALSDEALRATKVIARLSHPVVEMQGKKAMQISFAKDSYAYRSKALGGVSFYAPGPANQPITNAKVFTFAFAVLFEEGFQFNIGGKLPGVYGGTSEEVASGCSGGRRDDACFSTRLMWRKNGEAELYAYLPPSAKAQNKKAVCSASNTSCDGDYGWSLGRGKWDWTPGTWQTVAQKVTLNDPGKNNGQVVIYVDGKEVYTADNIVMRMSDKSVPRGMMVQSFFGGHDITWASPKNQKAYFSDFSMAVLE